VNAKQVVIDASVALKWRLRDEEATLQADALLDDFLASKLDLFTPTLFDYEIANALKVAVTMGRLTENEALSAIADFQQYDIEMISSVPTSARFKSSLSSWRPNISALFMTGRI
jgi:predicted nucleic acid-binding protein